MLERRRACSTSLRIEPMDGRRDSSFWIPAFSAAAAASECGGECDTGGEGEWLRKASVVEVEVGWAMRVCSGEPDDDLDGGSELRSGGIVIGAAQALNMYVCSSVYLGNKSISVSRCVRTKAKAGENRGLLRM